MSRLKLDLHPMARNGKALEAELNRVFREAQEKRIQEIEIIHGKGSGQLKKRILKFLERPDIKASYKRVIKDSDNSGRLFVRF